LSPPTARKSKSRPVVYRQAVGAGSAAKRKSRIGAAPCDSKNLPPPPTTHYPLATGNWQLATNNWQLATGNWQLATGNWQLTTGNWQLATGNWQLATGNWQLAFPHLTPSRSWVES
jgi:hypothetical protein